ncbi:corepressor interacting with RBPJ 1-like [Artemia franciscana]|uniref:CBF1-interacting co-repressor CIR N-terminal domain-containing protein n=1 Tax=Artemia franciscana TaxID=6661 RepID=A0AA88H784_ARTSF|nr:hypothetical protein QYM36_016218 [Artemia franciscana]KAK2706118.1 hypothetical protein QYM36_016218 [Artemia franciscana]
MGKGFNNYMCKKFFHPASRDNLKRVWMAEQKAAAEKQKQDELRIQYEKEQDVFNNRALVSKESKDKLSVNFMYEQPPGLQNDHIKEDGEAEFKFEWQRKYNAPRESYCKDNTEIKDQPFGIPVRNVRCLKCRKWGHINTDRECPMFASFSGVEAGSQGSDTFSLMRQMREEGLQLKRSAVNTLDGEPVENVVESRRRAYSGSESEEDIGEEMELLKNLTYKQKKKLLKKIKKLEKEKKRVKGTKSYKTEKEKYRLDSDTDDSEKMYKVEKSKEKEYLKGNEDSQRNFKRNKYFHQEKDEHFDKRKERDYNEKRDHQRRKEEPRRNSCKRRYSDSN